MRPDHRPYFFVAEIVRMFYSLYVLCKNRAIKLIGGKKMSKSVEVTFNDGTKKSYDNAEAEREHEFLKIYHGDRYSDRVRGEVRMEDVRSWENIGQGEEASTGGEDLDWLGDIEKKATGDK